LRRIAAQRRSRLVRTATCGSPRTRNKIEAEDVNGDGKADLVWRETQNGDVAVWLMDGARVINNYVVSAGVPLVWQIQ
jgi:hypothetical protein